MLKEDDSKTIKLTTSHNATLIILTGYCKPPVNNSIRKIGYPSSLKNIIYH